MCHTGLCFPPVCMLRGWVGLSLQQESLRSDNWGHWESKGQPLAAGLEKAWCPHLTGHRVPGVRAHGSFQGARRGT